VTLPSIVLVMAAVTSLALAPWSLGGRWRGLLQWSFALGMVGFAAESATALVLMTSAESAEDRLLWLGAREIASLLVICPWVLFVTTFIHQEWAKVSRGWRLGLVAVGAGVFATSAAIALWPGFQVPDLPAPFYAARLDRVGRYAVALQLVATVGLLVGFEICLRTLGRDARWKVKYLLLGLGGIFLARFYFLSQILLFHVLMATYLTTQAAVLVVGNLLVGASLARDRLHGTQLTISHQMFYRSVVAGTLGLYLVVVGGLGWFLNNWGFPEELLWGSVVVFVAVLGLAVLALSENLRWRVRRFLALHVYRSKYDYREQWIQFTARLTAVQKLEDLAPRLLRSVLDAVGTAKGLLYLAEPRDGRYYLAAISEVAHAAPVLDANAPPVARLQAERRPLHLGDLPGVSPSLTGGLVVPLYWRDTFMGMLLLGPERAGASYTLEDLEFLETVGKQVAGALLTARLSETLAQAREFEAFHRLTSFVVHDVKNSISALSMLSENALANFDDPEFQRDAITTLSRTVDRMKNLLGRLSVSSSAALHFQPADLAALVLEALRPVQGRGVTIIKELSPVPPVAGDPEALLRIVQNLVTNAVEALGGRGGVVTVKTYQDGDGVSLAVSDTGCGMSEEFIRNSLFVPFRSTKNSGWGIGLHHTKGLVEAHRGTIEVTSKEGLGTTFTVRLPVASA